MSLFYAKLLLVVLLCIPVAVLGVFLLEQLMDEFLKQAKRNKEDRMERTKIDNRKPQKRNTRQKRS